MNDRAEAVKRQLTRLRGQREALDGQYDSVQATVLSHEDKIIDLDIVRSIIQASAKQVQSQLSYHIAGIVTLALDTCWPEKYKFKLDFVERRSKIECDVLITSDGHDFNPMDDNGGSVVDVLSFALRVAMWSLGQSAPVIFLDEPFRFLSAKLRCLMTNVVTELSDRLGIQFIIVSHDSELISAADNLIYVQQEDGVSYVEQETLKKVKI